MRKKFSASQAFRSRLMPAAALSLIASQSAWAGWPLATEDAGVLDRGECELETLAGRTGEPKVRGLWTEAGCGIGFNTQLELGVGREESEGQYRTTTTLDGKTFVRELTDRQAGFTFAYTLSGVGLHTGSSSFEGTQIIGVVTIPHGDWLFHGNLGWQRAHPSHRTTSVFNLALERIRAYGPLDLMAEVFGSDRDAPWAQIGARWTIIPERLFIGGAWGVQANSGHTRQFSIGIKAAF